jgi:hypothetical protein
VYGRRILLEDRSPSRPSSWACSALCDCATSPRVAGHRRCQDLPWGIPCGAAGQRLEALWLFLMVSRKHKVCCLRAGFPGPGSHTLTAGHTSDGAPALDPCPVSQGPGVAGELNMPWGHRKDGVCV